MDPLVKNEVRMAILELRVTTLKSILVWTLTPLALVATTAIKYAFDSNETTARMETQITEMKKQLTEITVQLNLTNTDLGAVQDWADERFELKINKQ